MSEHPTKGHLVASIIMVAIIAALVGWGIGLMNPGLEVACWAGAALIFVFGAVMMVKLGPDSH